MSFQKNNSYEEINELNDKDQNEFQIDTEQYFLFNGQGFTPQGDEVDNNININNSFYNNINLYEHSNNNYDNLMDNEYSAAPIPLRRREPDISYNNNILIESNINNDNFNENDNDLINSNNIFHNEIKSFAEHIDNVEKYISHNDFSCFNPNFIDNDKILEEGNIMNNINNINNIYNNEENNNININQERITPFPGMNENINAQNINIMDAPANNNLANSSSSQNTNAASLSGISNNDNSLIISSQFHILSNNNEKNGSTFSSDENKNMNNNNNQKITKTKSNNETKNDKTKQKKKYLRKFKPDSIRKKIKARLHKKIRDIINKKLKDCGSKMLFDYFPQPFITNVNVIQNKAYLKLTMRTLFKMVFGNKSKDKEKVKTNLKVLNYLDSNNKIRIESGVDVFLNSTYEDIIQKYISGKLFDDDVQKLHSEGESKEYINKYQFIGKHWVEFYKNNGKKLIVE